MVYEDFIWWDDRGKYTSPVADAIVYKEGDYAVAKVWNEQWGRWSRIAKSTDHASVIQAALDSLTSGRTWKETVILTDNFTINSTIKIPSFTRLINLGTIETNNDINIIENLDTVNGNTGIEIIGGRWEHYGTGAIFSFTNVSGAGLENSHNIIRDVYIKHGTTGISITSSNFITIRDVVIYAVKNSGIVLSGYNNNICVDNVRMTRFDNQYSTGAGIDIKGVAGIDIVNTSVFHFNNGLRIQPDGSWSGGCRWISAVNCIFENNTDAAILVDGYTNDLPVWGVHLLRVSGTVSLVGLNVKGSQVMRVICDNCWFSDNKREGVVVSLNARDVELLNSYIAGNSAESDKTYDGVYISTAAVYIRGCHFVRRHNQSTTHRYHIYNAGYAYVFVENNELNDYGTGAIGGNWVQPYIIKNNKGYPTENSGTATITAGNTSVTVNHGLADTPSKVLVTPLGDPGDRYWVENVTSTSFDIVVGTAPSSDIQFYWYAEV